MLASLALVLACYRAPAPVPPEPIPEPPALPPELPLPCESIYRLEVRKSARTLIAECEGGGRREFTVALSRSRDGAKRRAGDWKTPEGIYRISGPPRASRFHLFVPIDYPTRVDVEAGLREGVIGPRTAARLLARLESGELLPQDTPLGGTLGFHGEGDRWRGDSRDLDWTYGCFALTDEDIDFIATRTRVGTPVVITP